MSLAMRNEVPVELTWDLSLIYPTEEAMYRDVEKMKALCASMEERFKGKLTTPEAICDCLNDLQEMTRLMTLIWLFRLIIMTATIKREMTV